MKQVVFILFLFHGFLFGQNRTIDSLKRILASTKIDSVNLQLRYNIGEATLNFRTGYWDSLYNDAISIGNKVMASAALNNLGFINNDLGDIVKALEYHYKSLHLREEIGDKPGIALSFNNIGYVYNSQGDSAKALEYYHKSMQIRKELNDQIGVAYSLNNIGVIYKDQGLISKALKYFEQALKIGEQEGDKIGIGNSLNNIGYIYKVQGNDKAALEYFQKGLLIRQKTGDKRGIAISLGNVANELLKTGRVQMAQDLANKGMEIALEIGFPQVIKYSANTLKTIFQKQNKYKEAFEMYELEIKMTDSINNQETRKASLQKQFQYYYEKQAAVASSEHKSELEKQQVIADEKNRKQKIVIWSVAIGLLLMVVFASFIFRSLSTTRKQKQLIEIKSRETEEQKKIIEEKQKDILDSIRYSKRIQQAKLPSKELIYSALPQSFVIFKPKDIVSGDFYYFHKNERSVFIASADCTGHGVPGALMSMIGSEKLNDAFAYSTDTSEVLKHLNKGIKVSLRQTDSSESTRDGMDIALCSVDTSTRVVKYAGANRPLWVIRNGQAVVEEFKATKKAIGGFTEDDQHFDTHTVQLQQGDTFYISTDGYADTFGGQKQKKITTKRFKEILLSIQHKSMRDQELHLDNFIENWKGGTGQIDDILVIGVRL